MRRARHTAVTASASVDRPAACSEILGLSATLEYARHVSAGEDGSELVERRLEALEIACAGVGGTQYRLVGTVSATTSRRSGLSCKHDGVLVGPGPLNNRPLTVAIRITEQPDGTATAAIVALHLSRRP